MFYNYDLSFDTQSTWVALYPRCKKGRYEPRLWLIDHSARVVIAGLETPFF
jgi:hypothetical protein